jgi:hypothetical protein
MIWAHNKTVSSEQATHFALKRALNKTSRNGYEHFVRTRLVSAR